MRSLAFLLCLPFLPFVTAPAYAAAPKTEASVNPEKIVCKKHLEVGTLAKYTKECRTQDEWRRIREASAEAGRAMRDKGFGEGCSLKVDPNSC